MLIRLGSLQNPLHMIFKEIPQKAKKRLRGCKQSKSLKIGKFGAHLDPTIFTIVRGELLCRKWSQLYKLVPLFEDLLIRFRVYIHKKTV